MTNRVFHALAVASMVVTCVSPSMSWGQHVSPGSGAHNMTDPNTEQQALLDQIRELQTEVAKLRTAVQQTDPMERSRAGLRTKMGAGGMGDQGEMGGRMGGGMGTGQNRGMSQGSGGGMGMMGMMMEDQGEMGGMSSGGSSGMGMSMMDDEGEMAGMSSGGMSSGGGGGMGMMEGEMGGMPSGGKMKMCCMGEMGGMMGGMKGSPSTVVSLK